MADGKGGNWTKAIGVADDFEDSNGSSVLDFWQAQERARAVARGSGQAEGKPVTVRQTLDEYKADLETRGGETANVARVYGHLPQTLADKAVALLTARDLRSWRDGLAKALAPATVNRTVTPLKAALNRIADHDERITSRQAWDIGLATIPDAEVSRNVILPESTVRSIIAEAYRESAQLGLLVETAAVTGARVSQLAKLAPHDLQIGAAEGPRLMMPTSRKGKGQKKVTHRPVPIPAGLAARLNTATDGALLRKPTGEPWKKSDHTRLFRRVVQRAGFDPAEVTIYALRHTNIVRQLLAGVPIRVVAVNHDTSIAMIERTYSRHIGDHADALARRALLDMAVS